MPFPSLPTLLLVLLALLFGFINGRNGSAGIVAPLLSTGTLGYRHALLLAAAAETTGPFVFGVAVAQTIGREVIAPEAVTLPVVYAALLAAVLWNAATLALGIPSSTSHSLVGGLVGAAFIAYGVHGVLFGGVLKVTLALFLAPLISMLAGFMVMQAVIFMARGATPHINVWFKRSQIVSAITLGLAYGSNDAQKIMGIIMLGLVATGTLTGFSVPWWVIALSAASIGGGTLVGGSHTIRTMSRKFYHIRPVHGASAQAASTAVILAAALFGGPVSTSHVVSSALVGAGSAERIRMIRWTLVERILLSWFITLPAAAAIGVVLYEFIKPFIG